MQLRVVIGYLVGYLFLDWVSYVHPVLPLGITPWNPPPALSLVLLLRFGLRYWPCLFVAAFAADVLVRGLPAPWPVHVEAGLLLTAAYTGAAYLLQRQLPSGSRIETAHDLGAFVLIVAPATLVVAGSYVLLFATVGRVPLPDLAASVAHHWVGDLNGILVFAPMLMLVGRPNWSRLAPPPRVMLEVAAQAISLALAVWIVFGLPEVDEFKFFYLLFLPLVWIAGRWGLPGASLALVGVQLGLIVAIQLGGYHTATFVQLQFLMLALAVTGLMLGTVVTQRERVERTLLRKESALNNALRFATAGEMTSALAHELNQPVAALSNYLTASQALLRAPRQDPRLLDETLGKAAAEAQRAGRVVQRLRDFFRRGATTPEQVELGSLIADVLGTVRSRAQLAEVSVVAETPARPQSVLADRTQVALVLHNLLINAIEAAATMPHERRLVRIGVEDHGASACVVVEDSGPGIDPQIEATMFEPFATSKAEGMGLGLAISRTLVRAHGGELTASGAAGGGARFVLTLPREADRATLGT
jgi:signal transduction histidine kinase